MTRAVVGLLRPKLLGSLHRGTRGRAAVRRPIALLVGGAVGFSLVFWVTARFLGAVRDVPDVGTLLATRLLGLGLLLFFGILLLSNLIAALSSFFLARDLPGLLAAPVDRLALYLARLGETLVSSSWMVALLLLPVLAAYQATFEAGLGFYAVAAAALVPFLVLPAALGSAVTLLLVRVFPARRTRDLLTLLTLGGVALLLVGLRVMRPERLVRPEEFRTLFDFLAALESPAFAWLPSEWMAQALGTWMEGRFDPFWLLLLWSSAAAAVVVGAWLHGRLFARGFTRAQEGVARPREESRAWHLLGALLSPLGTTRRELVLKDVRVFFRDNTQWSQLLVLAVLLVVYVYNMQVLPLQSSEAVGRFLVSLIVFLNLLLAGFIVAAVAARFVFPAYSLEGPTLWLLRSSPLRPATLLWSKFWTGAVPLLTLALLLTGVTNAVLGVEAALAALSLATIAALSLAMVSQALAWGVALPKPEAENAAQIPTSLGGLLYMVGALLTLAAVIAAQFWILRDFLWSGLPGRVPRSPLGGELALAVLATLLVCGIATLLPYGWARRKLERPFRPAVREPADPALRPKTPPAPGTTGAAAWPTGSPRR